MSPLSHRCDLCLGALGGVGVRELSTCHLSLTDVISDWEHLEVSV